MKNLLEDIQKDQEFFRQIIEAEDGEEVKSFDAPDPEGEEQSPDKELDAETVMFDCDAENCKFWNEGFKGNCRLRQIEVNAQHGCAQFRPKEEAAEVPSEEPKQAPVEQPKEESKLDEAGAKNALRQYLETALWSSTDDDDNPLDDEHDIKDIDRKSMMKAKNDLNKFYKMAGSLLDGLDDTDIGHDFWLTRNGHGAGFWDGDYEKEVGEALTKISKKFREVYMYVGDDGKVHMD